MKSLIKIIKGSFVGMGSILPGISGSMIAAILNIYSDLISALNQFTKAPLKSILLIWQYLAGILLGLGIGFVFINLFLDIFPIPMTLLFIGFILGAIPTILKEIRVKKFQYHHFLVMGLSMLMMVLFLFIQEGQTSTDSWTYYLIVFLIGAITAAALITPGLSGATLLMALGYFQILIELGNDTIEALVTLNFSEIAPMIPMLLLLFLGVVLGLIFMGKVMYRVLKSYKVHFYFAVLGIVIVSPFNILFTLQSNTTDNVFQASWYVWLIGLVLFIFGIFLTHIITNKGQQTEEIS